MTIQSKGAGAGHLESLAVRMTEIDTRPNDGHMLGMKEKVDEAIDHLLRAMFPYHFGKSRARFVETEKRTYELMRAYDALVQTLELVFRDPLEAAEKADELINSLPDILEILKTDDLTRLRFMAETPVIPGAYLRISARLKAVAGNLPSVRIGAWAGNGGRRLRAAPLPTGDCMRRTSPCRRTRCRLFTGPWKRDTARSWMCS